MTDPSNVPELQDLEPLDAGGIAAPGLEPPGAGAPGAGDATLLALRSGLPPPAFNPRCTDKTSYKFLMCSVLMLIGCCMPFGADVHLVGYKTMSGAVFTFIALGMLWTWWGAIHNNRSTKASFKWLLLCFVPLAVQAMHFIAYEPLEALKAAKEMGFLPSGAQVSTWSDLFTDIGTALGKSADAGVAAAKVETFFRCFGAGRFFVFLGALLTEVYLVLGVVGGAKKNKMDKLAKQSTGAERRRR
jgi:hypothetical protein